MMADQLVRTSRFHPYPIASTPSHPVVEEKYELIIDHITFITFPLSPKVGSVTVSSVARTLERQTDFQFVRLNRTDLGYGIHIVGTTFGANLYYSEFKEAFSLFDKGQKLLHNAPFVLDI